MIRPLLSILSLMAAAFALGKEAWIPPLRLLQDTEWDLGLWPWSLGQKAISLVLFIGMLGGLLGWAGAFRRVVAPSREGALPTVLFFAVAVVLFGLCVWSLAVNEVLDGPLLIAVLIPSVPAGFRESKRLELSKATLSLPEIGGALVLLILWGGEFLSPPLIWDAVLDHFRYARETVRLHQVLFHWVNHTGDMPKAAEMVLAGFWAVGGEGLSKMALALPLLIVLGLCAIWFREEKVGSRTTLWVLLSCPFLLALFAWGYVEGFLACFEILALFMTWKILRTPRNTVLYLLAGVWLGFCFSIKATALFAALGVAAVWLKGHGWKGLSSKAGSLFLAGFSVAVIPWYLKGLLAFGDPFYPLGIHLFGGGPGYSVEMEKALLADTGLTGHWPWKTIGDCFFTARNGVNAAWTPLFAAVLPWAWTFFRSRLGNYLSVFSIVFLLAWAWVDQSLRHASGAALALLLFTGLAWDGILTQKGRWGKPLFALGTALSLWLTLVAQFNATAPYAAALGLEDPLIRLRRHYSFDTSTYRAYRDMERHSGPKDKVLAFAVFQTYPLERTTFVDFKWKKPIFLEWAKEEGTAERLAKRLKEEGVEYFLYQRDESIAMSHVEKDFDLAGMSSGEYRRFWKDFMEPVGLYPNCFVYRLKTGPGHPPVEAPIPGEAEGILGKP